MSSSLNSSVPHFALFSSAFSALLKSFSDEFSSCDFTIFVDKNIDSARKCSKKSLDCLENV